MGNRHTGKKSALDGQHLVRRVWMFSYECAGIALAGGLGEAVAGLSKTLNHDFGLKIIVFLPSHGRHLDRHIGERYHFEELTTFIASDYRTGANGVRYGFLSGVVQGERDGIEYVLVKGLDPSTSRWLDDRILYDNNLTFEKMALFARTAKAFTEYLISTGRRSELPDLIHAHDWHMVPAGVAVKQHLLERGFSVPLIFTVHLLSQVALPWHYASEDWCGIKDLPTRVQPGGNENSRLSAKQVWQGMCDDSLESFGCHLADYVTSVSESYLTNDVRGYIGEEIKGKSGYIYNGCDWDPSIIRSTVLSEHPELFETQVPARQTDRSIFRNYLLTDVLSRASPPTGAMGEDDSIVEPGSKPVEPVESFPTDGPLVMMTGRLSPQKGADLLIEAAPIVRETIPDAKFLLFLLPSSDSTLTQRIQTAAAANRDSVRVVLGKYPSIYRLSHLAADVYAMPSRSEPFGISALEAMITGNPVVGTNIGGLKETVLDISSFGDKGTGLLIPPNDPRSLAEALVSVLLVMKIDGLICQEKGDSTDEAERIPIKFIKTMVARNPRVGSILRENCVKRVQQNFRWRNAGETALNRYHTASRLADRAIGRP